jgi:transposase
MLLTMKDKKKIEVIVAVIDGKIEVEGAGKVLERSVRQVYRMVRAVREEGIQGLIHKNRGKESPRKVKDTVQERIITLAREKYRDVNDTHLRELLLEKEGITVGRETLRGMLRKAGIPPKRKRRRVKYRKRRERKEAFGVMLQIDASRHDWLEGRGPSLTLVGAKDDATGYAWGRFVPAETTWAYLNLLREIISSHGLPLSLYSDRHSIFHAPREATIIEQLKNIQPLTQFGRAMDELGITITKAWSPQAKGRIERHFGILQDRLVVELRLAGTRTLEEANQVLDTFLVHYNRQFTCAPRVKKAAIRKAPPAYHLDRILCLKETRVVNKDHTVSFEGLVLQIPPSRTFHSIAKQHVEVLQLRDGSVEILYKQRTVARFIPEAITRLLLNGNVNRTQLQTVA